MVWTVSYIAVHATAFCITTGELLLHVMRQHDSLHNPATYHLVSPGAYLSLQSCSKAERRDQAV
jgi:hypothetical protein